MNIYLAGPEGPEQIADKWQLQERGYRVVTAGDVRNRDLHSEGIQPSPTEFARMQAYEMLRADAVVVNEGLTNGQIMRLVNVCNYMGVRVLDQSELPAQCPHVVRQDEILDELDLAATKPMPGLREEVRTTLRLVMAKLEAAARWFDGRFGWFFQNGNKAPRQPRPYPTNGVKPTLTA